MSDTPRTDAAFDSITPTYINETGKASMRQLERELNQWRECAEALAHVLRGGPMLALAKFDALKFDALKKGETMILAFQK